MHVIRRLKLLSGVAGLLALSVAATGCKSNCGGCYQQCCSPGGQLYPQENCCGTQQAMIGTPTPMRSQGCACNSTVVTQAYQPTPTFQNTASLGTPVATTYHRPGMPSRPLWRLSQQRGEPRAMGQTNQVGCQPCQQQRQMAGCSTCAPQPQQQAQAAYATQARPSCNTCQVQQVQHQTAMVLRPVPVGQAVPESTWEPVRRVSNEAPPLADPGVQQAGSSSMPQLPITLLSPGEVPITPAPLLVLQNDNREDLPMPTPKRENNLPDNNMPKPRMNGDKAKKPAGSSATGWPDIPAPVVINPPAAPREFQKHALSAYIIEPPDVLRIDSINFGDRNFPIEGPHLVRPDGTIGLGTFGAVFVAGMTLDQAKMQIVQTIMRRIEATRGDEDKAPPKKGDNGEPAAYTPRTPQQLFDAIRVDVAAFNSKFYYVITDGGGYGETVARVPCTGNETVLDAISQIQGLPAVASKKKIWVARATPHDQHHPMILPVDWCGITQRGSASTNYQVFPGDRVYVNSDCRIRLDSHLAKILTPIERLFGVTLLGSTTVNSIKGQQGF